MDNDDGRVLTDQALSASPTEPVPVSALSGNDPSRVEILSLGKSDIGCTPERWREVFQDYAPRARGHAANLAAHNWDVLLIGGRVLLSSYYGGGHWLNPGLSLQDTSLQKVTEDELAKLYDAAVHPRRRLFCDSDGSAEGGETGTGSTVGDSADPKGIAQ